MIKKEDLHKTGVFAKPHGVKGEISLITDYDLTGMAGDPYIVCNLDDIFVPFFIESCRQKSAANLLLKFENLDSAEKVKFLTGKTAFVPLELLPIDDDRPLHLKALTGYTIVDDRSGVIGVVIDVDDSTPNILFKVDYKGDDILIPLALITSIQHPYQTMATSLPDGFLALYSTTNETAK
jgi:16S rRNA processing protein RimM